MFQYPQCGYVTSKFFYNTWVLQIFEYCSWKKLGRLKSNQTKNLWYLRCCKYTAPVDNQNQLIVILMKSGFHSSSVFKMKCMYLCQKALENFSFSYIFSFWYIKSQNDTFLVSSHFESKKKKYFISLNSYTLVKSLSIPQAIVCSYLLFYSVNTVFEKYELWFYKNSRKSNLSLEILLPSLPAPTPRFLLADLWKKTFLSVKGFCMPASGSVYFSGV